MDIVVLLKDSNITIEAPTERIDSHLQRMIPAMALKAVTEQELAKAAALFGTLKQLRLKLKNVDDAILDRAFEIHVQGVLEKLETRLPSLNDRQLKNVEVTMAKHGLYDAAFQQVIILCHNSKFLYRYLQTDLIL